VTRTAVTRTLNEVIRNDDDHEWNATVRVLAWPSIAARTLGHVDAKSRSIDWDAIRDSGWSSTEEILIDAAFGFWTARNDSLWGGQTLATFAALARSLNGTQLGWLLDALNVRRARS
jgi:hypothetical protein